MDAPLGERWLARCFLREELTHENVDPADDLTLVAYDSSEPGTLLTPAQHSADAGSDTGTPSGACGPEALTIAACGTPPRESPPACRRHRLRRGERRSPQDSGLLERCHSDCAASERCLAGRCLARVENPAGVQFERVYIAVLRAHASTPNIPEDQAEEALFVGGTGFGVAPIDFDGDLDLDPVGAEGGVGACLYENCSKPTQPLFRAVDGYCDEPVGKWHGGVSTDLEGDGVHESSCLAPGSWRSNGLALCPVGVT